MNENTSNTNWLGFSLIIVFVLVAVGLLGYLYFNSQSTSNTNSTKTTTATKTTTKQVKTAQVSITSSGFVPASLTVTQGTQVTWTNADTAVHQVASDPYPLDDTLPNLKSDPLAKGDSFSFTFEKKGTFTYHDEKNPLSIKGTIIVN